MPYLPLAETLPHSKRLSSFHTTKNAHSARYFHRVTADLITHDVRGNLVREKVPIMGNLRETYVLIDPGVGSALRAVGHTSRLLLPVLLKMDVNLHFSMTRNTLGSGKIALCNVSTADANNLFSMIKSSSYHRLHIPNQLLRQTDGTQVRALQFCSLAGRCTR